jgi:hypothetical protein
MQALTTLHSDHWPLQSIDYDGTTKNRIFRYSNLVNIDYGGTTKNKTFCCSNLVNIDYAGTTKIEHSAVLT